MQDPETYLKERGIKLRSFFDDSRPAVLDAQHRARVNYELYFFADAGERTRFRANPGAYCGLVTDPVTHMRFQPDPDSPRIDFNEQPFFFQSNASRTAFAAKPDSFALPRFKMSKMKMDAPGKDDDQQK